MAEVVATQTFHVGTKTGTVTIYKGQRVNKNESYVKNAAPGMFVLADEYVVANDPVVHKAVEATTAAPGETRQVKKPARIPRVGVSEVKKPDRKKAAKK